MSKSNNRVKHPLARRVRGFLPVVVDVETGGFNCNTDALLEIAAVILDVDEHGLMRPGETVHAHVQPFAGANIEKAAKDFLGYDPFSQLRLAIDEKTALEAIFAPINKRIKETGCTRAILCGHNAFFDLSFVKAAADRHKLKSPFHQFSTLDSVTLGALVYGQTVLAKTAMFSGMPWDNDQAHSALYDTQKTADLFCSIFNRYPLPVIDAINRHEKD
jgi:ribonuclease T